jgi:5-methylcytosine-specific restriction endonuclease McrA
MEYRVKCLKQKLNLCNVCGSTGKLSVHHIDGDRSNNSLDNLVPVCQSCHSKIHSPNSHDAVTDEYTEKLPPSSLNRGNKPHTDKNAPTTIRIASDTRDRLRAEKNGGETYSDVIERLLDD